MIFLRSLSLRWLEIVANFKFTVDYRKAALNIDVDFLSRHGPNAEEGSKADRPPDGNDDIDHESNALISNQISWNDNPGHDEKTEECFKAEQDEIINQVKNWMNSAKIPETKELQQMPIELHQYLGIMSALQIQPNGLLVRKKLEGQPCERSHQSVQQKSNNHSSTVSINHSAQTSFKRRPIE